MHVQCEEPTAITIEGTQLKRANTFTYLGGNLSDDTSLDPEIQRRVSRGAAAFNALRTRCFDRNGLSLATKVNVYKATVLPSLLYGSETWPTLAHHIRRLEVFHQRSLRQIMNIKWWHRVTNTEVLERANCSSIESMIRRSRLRWLGHVSRMDNSRIPKQLLFGELKLGKCNRGRPRKRWKDCIKEDLRAFQIDLKTWYKVAQDRCLWRRALFSGLETCELRLRERAAEQRKRRHQRATDPPSS